MMQEFGGCALVTGASSGIGAAFVRALAARKVDVVLVARRKAELTTLAAEVEREHGVKTLVVEQDLAVTDGPRKVYEAVAAAKWSVGLLVNNAGFGAWAPFEEVPLESDLKMVDLNCRVPVELTHHFAPAMLERKKGGLIFLASIAAYQPTPWFATYGATKGFNLLLAESLWAEFKGRGVSVLGVSPGYTETGFQQVAQSAAGPKGSVATPAEVVEASLARLGRQPSFVHGASNAAVTFAARLLPRALMASLSGAVSKPKKAVAAAPVTPPVVQTDTFQRSVMRLLLVFLSVATLDTVFLSVFTQQWRIWFPVWFDAGWAQREHPWVLYSQSYFAGIFMAPVLALALYREFLGRAAGWVRGLYAGLVLGIMAFLAWWKGGLMVEFGKQREAVGWAVLTALIYGVVTLAEKFGAMREAPSRRVLLQRLTMALSMFFLVIAVADPILQLGLQGLAYSSGLGIEMGVFFPAGFILAGVSWRLRAR